MKISKKTPGNNAVAVRLALHKLCIAACLAAILSLFLFACGSSRQSGSNTDTAAVTPQADTSMSMPTDTSSMRNDTTQH